MNFPFFDRFCPVELNGGKGTGFFEAVGAIKGVGLYEGVEHYEGFEII